MVTRTSPSYEHAERFFADLNDRQVTVLQLIAAGRTNSEIAEELDMTLAGAKWNVSKILTKLGLDVREEAAAFYRWHTAKPRRLRQLLRGLIALGPLKATVVAGSAGVPSTYCSRGDRVSAARRAETEDLDSINEYHQTWAIYGPHPHPRATSARS